MDVLVYFLVANRFEGNVGFSPAIHDIWLNFLVKILFTNENPVYTYMYFDHFVINKNYI